MIGWLQGVLREKRPPRLLVDVGGVGYELEAPMTTHYVLPSEGEQVTLHVHQVVREDAHNLYGFARLRDRDAFRALLRVNGVGAKVGLAILSGLDADALARAIEAGDTATLARLPGIGKKTAERLVVELRDRLGSPGSGPGGTVFGEEHAGTGGARADPVEEAVAALVALGFRPQEASQRVRAVDCAGLAAEAIIREALRAVVVR